jgi:uncharacterized integral membrane protein
MLAKTRSTPVHSPAPGAAPNRIADPVSGGSPVAGDPQADAARAAHRATPSDRETRRERSRRKAHRTRLHGYAVVTVALVAFLIALAVSNTAEVKISWVFGTSRVSLVWLVLSAAILGWMLGLLATAAFHWRTRAPRRQRNARA